MTFSFTPRLVTALFILQYAICLSSDVTDHNGSQDGKTDRYLQGVKPRTEENKSIVSYPLSRLSWDTGQDRQRNDEYNHLAKYKHTSMVCPSGHYLQRSECKHCESCEKKQYEISACTATRNTICLSHKHFKIALKCLQLHKIRRIGHLLKRKQSYEVTLPDADQAYPCSSKYSTRLVIQMYAKLGIRRNLMRSLKTEKHKERTRTVKREATLHEMFTSTSTSTPNADMEAFFPLLPTSANGMDKGGFRHKHTMTGGRSKLEEMGKDAGFSTDIGRKPVSVEDDVLNSNSSPKTSSSTDWTWLYSVVTVVALIMAVSIFVVSRLMTRKSRMSVQRPHVLSDNNSGQANVKEENELIELEGFSSKPCMETNVINELTKIRNLSQINESGLESIKKDNRSLSFSHSLNLEGITSSKLDKLALKPSVSQPHLEWLSKTSDINAQNDYRSYHSEAETQTDGETLSHDSKTVFGTPWQFSGTLTRDGGVLQRENSDVVLVVGREAIKSGEYVKIQGAVFTDATEIRRKFDLSPNEMLITPLVEYHVEEAYQFQQHVSVKLPHALPEDFDVSFVKFYTFVADDCGNVQLESLPMKSKDNSNVDVEDADAYWEVSSQERIFIAKTTHFSGYFCTTCESKLRLPSIYARVFGSHVQIKSTRKEVRLILYIWDRRINIKDFLETIMQQECDMDRQLLADEAVPLLDNATSDSSMIMRMEALGDRDDQQCWCHVTRSDAARPLFKPLQVRKLRQIVLCCQQSDPMRVEWAMENVLGTSPSSVFQCLIEMVHVPEGVTNYEEAFREADEEYIRTFYVRNLKLTKDSYAEGDILPREEILKKALSQIMGRKDMESICQAFGINKKDIGNMSRKFKTEDALKTELLEECSRKCGVEKFIQVLPHVLKETQLFHVIQALQAKDLLSNLSSSKSMGRYQEANCTEIPESTTFNKSLARCTVSEPRQCQSSNLDYNSLNCLSNNQIPLSPHLKLNIDSSLVTENETRLSPDSDYSSPPLHEGIGYTDDNYHAAHINFSTQAQFIVPHFSQIMNSQQFLPSEDCNPPESSVQNTSCSMTNNFASTSYFTDVSGSDFEDSCEVNVDSKDLNDLDRIADMEDHREETFRKELDALSGDRSRDVFVAFPEIPEEQAVSQNGPSGISTSMQCEKQVDNRSRYTQPYGPDETHLKETFV